MLISAVVTLQPAGEAQPYRYLGRAAHGLFLRLMERADAAASASLHEDGQTKPFTASCLSPGWRRSATSVCYLRFTSYDERLSRLLADSVLTDLPRQVELDGLAFSVAGLALEPAAHPWASQSSYTELSRQALIEKRTGPKTVRLFFASPTTFRRLKGQNVPLPLPGLVFGSLVDRWNAFSPITVPAEVRKYAEECVVISHHNIRTHMVEVAGGKQVGFTGTCSFTTVNYDPYWWRLVTMLADFAFYSGAGAKTTMGMGQCRRLDSPPSRGMT